MSQVDVSKLFNKFAGKKISGPTGRTFDPVKEELFKIGDDNGLNVRIIYPGQMVTEDYRLDRVNVNVEQDTAGGFRISKNNNFGLG
jgi:hypothetical protein